MELSPFFYWVICIFYIGVTSLFYYCTIDCNLLNWSYLPFLFWRLHSQSIKLELPPFFILELSAIYYIGVTSLFYILRLSPLQSIILELSPFFILRDCIAIFYIGVTSLFYFWIALQSIILELPPFFILRDCIAIF